jgi:hypothetical protein
MTGIVSDKNISLFYVCFVGVNKKTRTVIPNSGQQTVTRCYFSSEEWKNLMSPLKSLILFPGQSITSEIRLNQSFCIILTNIQKI